MCISSNEYKNRDIKLDMSLVYSKSPEEERKEAADVFRAELFLASHGIQAKTKYGNYRPLYDVLKELGVKLNAFSDFVGNMRDVTQEESKYFAAKLEEISEPTGVNFYD